MNRERARELLPVIQAFAEGEEIEYRRSNSSSDRSWRVPTTPYFSDDHEYRVKPSPREFWVRPCEFGEVRACNADRNVVASEGWIKVIEVLDE